MSTLREIEEAIAKLSASEFRALALWVRQHEASLWDQEMEHDERSGRLDFLIKELDNDVAAGRAKPADEVLREQ